MTRGRKPRCSFCGKADDEVQTLVASPTVFICDGCVEMCEQVISADRANKLAITIGEREYLSWSYPESARAQPRQQ